MSDQGFHKKLRLLASADYQAVFNGVETRVSSRYFLILATFNQSSHCRLGIIVAKKNIAKANQRNRIKRIIRESFRLKKLKPLKNTEQKPPQALDIVVLIRKGLDQVENGVMYAQLDNLWKDLRKKASERIGQTLPTNNTL